MEVLWISLWTLIFLQGVAAVSFSGLPASVNISEDTTARTLLKDMGVSSDITCCHISQTLPSNTDFQLDGYVLYFMATSTLEYDTVSKYNIYVCCDDGTTTITSSLTVYITDTSTRSATETPSFVLIGLIVCSIPIGILFGLSCALLVVTIYIH